MDWNIARMYRIYRIRKKLTAKLNKIVAHIWAKILFGPSCYFAVVGVGLSPVLASVLGAVAFALSFIYFEKLELIFSTSIEANEVLHNEEDCKKFHEMVKMWDKNVLSVLVLAIWKTPSFLIVLPGLIKMIMDQKYVGVSIIGASLIFTIPNAVGQCYVKFSKEFIEKKNEIEIKHFFKSIEDVVLGPNESNKENISKRLRQVQFAFVSRIRKRKKTLFYHPANIVSAILGVGMNAYSICTFTFKNDLLFKFRRGRLYLPHTICTCKSDPSSFWEIDCAGWTILYQMQAKFGLFGFYPRCRREAWYTLSNIRALVKQNECNCHLPYFGHSCKQRNLENAVCCYGLYFIHRGCIRCERNSFRMIKFVATSG